MCRNMPSQSIYYNQVLCRVNAYPQRLPPLELAAFFFLYLIRSIYVRRMALLPKSRRTSESPQQVFKAPVSVSAFNYPPLDVTFLPNANTLSAGFNLLRFPRLLPTHRSLVSP